MKKPWKETSRYEGVLRKMSLCDILKFYLTTYKNYLKAFGLGSVLGDWRGEMKDLAKLESLCPGPRSAALAVPFF